MNERIETPGPTVIPDTRKVEILEHGQWVEVAFKDLKKGDLARMFEPDGQPVDGGEVVLLLHDATVTEMDNGDLINTFSCEPAGRKGGVRAGD